MTLPGKKYRVIKAPIILDSEIELEYLQAKHAVDVRSAELLSTAADRIRVARASVQADDELNAAEAVRDADAAELDGLKAVMAEKKAALDANIQWFTFRALGRKTWVDLCKRHPASEEDTQWWLAEGGKGPTPFNQVSLLKELLPLSCVSPTISPEEAVEIVDGENWNAAEVAVLFSAARYVQIQGSDA